jgi:hypothetical protein
MKPSRNANSWCQKLVVFLVFVSTFLLLGLNGCYNPYNEIQSVIANRLNAMEWSNNAWEEYILQ